MSLFASLFSLKVPGKPSGKKEPVYLAGTAKFDLQIIVQEGYQAALETICGQRRPQGVKQFQTASLKLENNNPWDKNAVRVEIRGQQVGYLPSEMAILFRQQLIARGLPKGIGQCAAVIIGGWISSDGRKGPYEVWLDLPTLPFSSSSQLQEQGLDMN